MKRDLSPPQWNSEIQASLSLAICVSNLGDDPLALDSWITNYSIGESVKLDWSVGNNAVNWPTGDNQRLLVLIPPRGCTAVLYLKGLNADTGVRLWPTGPIVLSPYSASGSPAGVVINSDITVNNVRCFIL